MIILLVERVIIMKKRIKKVIAGLSSIAVLSGALFINCGNVSANSGKFTFYKNDDGTYTAYYITRAGEYVRNSSMEKVISNRENIKTYLDMYLMLNKGDVNGDNKIDLSDAKITLKAALGIIELSDEEKEQCDLLSTGENVDLYDSYDLLRAALGITFKEPPIVGYIME